MTTKTVQSDNVTNMSQINASNTPLVKPEAVSGSNTPEHGRTAQDWAARALAANSESLAAKAVMKAACATAVAEYYKAVTETESDATAGLNASEIVEEAKQSVARAYCDAILANVFDRSEVRSQLGTAFGFEMGKPNAMGQSKPTSKPLEPGLTISKRVSSVSIAAEYAMTGQLPDRGGDSLPLVGQEEVQELLADYFGGEITVRAASERLEKAIREARVSIPLEMDADKLARLAGKIETASAAIANDTDLREAYTALFQIIASIPFPVEVEEAA